MQVYVELAVIENFCMDFTLLYSAKIAVKNLARVRRVALGAALGAAFATVFPLFGLSAVWSAVVKVASGLLICLTSGRFKGIKSYLKFTFAFFVFTAILGGALIGVFSLTGLDYSAGQGYMLSSVPIGIPLFCALLLIIGARKLAARLQKNRKDTVTVRIFSDGAQAEVKGFFDSGNKVYSKGAPVSILPEEVAKKLIDENRIKDGVKIHTVAGSKIIKIFTADRVEIDTGERTDVVRGVSFGISPQRIEKAVLHCDLLEDIKIH